MNQIILNIPIAPKSKLDDISMHLKPNFNIPDVGNSIEEAGEGEFVGSDSTIEHEGVEIKGKDGV